MSAEDKEISKNLIEKKKKKSAKKIIKNYAENQRLSILVLWMQNKLVIY